MWNLTCLDLNLGKSYFRPDDLKNLGLLSNLIYLRELRLNLEFNEVYSKGGK